MNREMYYVSYEYWNGVTTIKNRTKGYKTKKGAENRKRELDSQSWVRNTKLVMEVVAGYRKPVPW